jgi:hypothetical protein
MSRLPALALLLAALAAPLPAMAQAQRVDDSASQVLSPLVRMKWEDLAPGGSNDLVGQVTVLVRLDVSPWRGRNARIYHVLSPQPQGRVHASWTTRGALLAGSLRDGERTLVFSGPITTDMLEDTFVIQLRADGDQMVRPEQLEFSFEIEAEGT